MGGRDVPHISFLGRRIPVIFYDSHDCPQSSLADECFHMLMTLSTLRVAHCRLPSQHVENLRDEGLVEFSSDSIQDTVAVKLTEKGRELLSLFTPQELASMMLDFDAMGARFYIDEIETAGQLAEFLVHKDWLIRETAYGRMGELTGKKPIINLPRPIKSATLLCGKYPFYE